MSKLNIRKITTKRIIMEIDFDDMESCYTQESTDFEWINLDEAMKILRACCKVHDIILYIDKDDFYSIPEENSVLYDINVMDVAADVAYYCYRAEKTALITKDYIYIISVITHPS